MDTIIETSMGMKKIIIQNIKNRMDSKNQTSKILKKTHIKKIIHTKRNKKL